MDAYMTDDINDSASPIYDYNDEHLFATDLYNPKPLNHIAAAIACNPNDIYSRQLKRIRMEELDDGTGRLVGHSTFLPVKPISSTNYRAIENSLHRERVDRMLGTDKYGRPHDLAEEKHLHAHSSSSSSPSPSPFSSRSSSRSPCPSTSSSSARSPSGSPFSSSSSRTSSSTSSGGKTCCANPDSKRCKEVRQPKIPLQHYMPQYSDTSDDHDMRPQAPKTQSTKNVLVSRPLTEALALGPGHINMEDDIGWIRPNDITKPDFNVDLTPTPCMDPWAAQGLTYDWNMKTPFIFGMHSDIPLEDIIAQAEREEQESERSPKKRKRAAASSPKKVAFATKKADQGATVKAVSGKKGLRGILKLGN